ncbi:MAG: amidohydrolase family protein, partial [Gammaproteobacteria bacterium]
LETLLPLTLALVGDAVLTLPEAIAALSLRPARVLGIEAGSLAPGTPADVCLFDPDVDRRLTEETLASAGKNTPFLGWQLRGKVTHTFVSGRLVFEDAATTR